MATAGTQTWVHPSPMSTAETATLAVRRWAFWGIVLAKMVAGWGVQWDIQWHVRIGRDSFWIAPHVMTYAGVAAIVLLSFGVLAWDTWRRRASSPAPDEVTAIGITSTPGFHLAAWGIALTVLAAPIDDLWHRLFGLDVTLWSPPHLLGLFGSLVNSAACLLIAGEIYPRTSGVRAAAIFLNAALLLAGLATLIQPSFRIAFLSGGVSFHLYAILGALVFPFAYLPAAKLTGWRSSPLIVLVVAVAITMIGMQIARAGFEILQPVSVIEAEIAKDPTSPIAVANAIARANGEQPGGRSLAAQVGSLLPVLALIVLDARRRSLTAALGFGLTMLGAMGWVLLRSPAFAPMAPTAGATAIALVLVVLAAGAGGLGGRWLSGVLKS